MICYVYDSGRESTYFIPHSDECEFVQQTEMINVLLLFVQRGT